MTERIDYRLIPSLSPPAPSDILLRKVVDSVDAKVSMRDIFQQLEIDSTFQMVNQLRLKLTTIAFPYLRTVEVVENESVDEQEQGIKAKELKEASLQKFKNIKRRAVN